jgi:hypothetical protein
VNEPAIAKVLAIGNSPDGRRELLRLELPNARYGLGEAVNHDPLVLSLASETDRKGHAEERTWKKTAGAGCGWPKAVRAFVAAAFVPTGTPSPGAQFRSP